MLPQPPTANTLPEANRVAVKSRGQWSCCPPATNCCSPGHHLGAAIGPASGHQHLARRQLRGHGSPVGGLMFPADDQGVARIVQFGAAPGHQYLTRGQQGGGVYSGRCSCSPLMTRCCCRIVQFGVGQNATTAISTRHQHLPRGQQCGCVAAAGGAHAPRRRPTVAGRVVQLSTSQNATAVEAPRHQDLARR